MFDEQGRYLRQWDDHDVNGDGGNNARNVCVAGDKVILTDVLHHRVEWFDRQGRYLGQLGSRGRQLGQFASANGVCVGHQRLFVSDSARHCIQVFQWE